jgi:hypothetical protein
VYFFSFADGVLERLRSLPIDPWRIEALEVAIEFELSRAPQDAGVPSEGSEVAYDQQTWIRPIVGISGDPDVVVYYVFNATHVVVIDIELA